jgi:hypothetical protein
MYFHLKPNWDGDDLTHREILMGILLEMESAILETFNMIRNRWQDAGSKIENLAKNNETVTCKWLNALISSDWAPRISFDSGSFRNALMTLEWHVPDSNHFGEICKAYRELYSFSTSHESNKTLLEALAEVEQILAAIRKAKTPKKVETAIKYMKKSPHRFKIIRESQVREALQVSINHSEDARGTNFARDIRESILQKVALQLGLTRSKGWLREFLKYQSDERQ